MDAHLKLIEYLVESFSLLPVGLFGWRDDFGWMSPLGQPDVCQFAATGAAGTDGGTLINITFGVITRAAPQLNIFAVGFPVTILAVSCSFISPCRQPSRC